MNAIERFLKVLDETPHKAMVTEVDGETVLPTSGAELGRLVANARGGLRERGVVKGDRVVLLAPNSARWVAADVAILAEGAVCVPLYARQDPDELIAMMRDCEPRLVVIADAWLERAVTSRWEDAPVARLDAVCEADPYDHAAARRTPDDPVTIIYTSGTSGEPKGVILTLANVDFMLPVVADALRDMMGEDAGDERVFHYLPLCFAGSRVVLWVCLFRQQGIMLSTDLNALRTELERARPNYMLNVPALLDRMRRAVEAKIAERRRPIQLLWGRGQAAFVRISRGEGTVLDKATYRLVKATLFDRVRDQLGADLRCLICGSAPLSPETQRWFEMLALPVYQVYGLTETTAIVTMDAPGRVTAGRVGRPIPGVDTRIGAEGELLVRGPNVFAGYWNKPEATADAFTDGDWFRTGDRVEIDADGNHRVVGRVKHLIVPSSGHNVAPEPIEQRLLAAIEGAEHAVVVGHGRPHLTAIISGAAVTEAAARDALDHVNADLPHYKRVRDVTIAPEPFSADNGMLTANTKLRRAVIEARHADAITAMYEERGR